MKKVTKTQVKAMVKKLGDNEELKVTLFPSKCGPANTIWVKDYEIELTKEALNLAYPQNEKTSPYLTDFETKLTNFDSIINDFAYYNCIPELGKNVHYYIEG